jgi:DNA-binding CsgD family transcriptional regulator
MSARTISLDSLERIVAASGHRQLAEVALQAYGGVVPGEHCSAILFNAEAHKVDDYLLNNAWLAKDTLFWQTAQQSLINHPLSKKFLSRRQSMSLVRSREVLDLVWKRTWLYNEVERPLGVEDLATVCQIMPSGHFLILTSGRGGRFSGSDLAAAQSFQRILDGLIQFNPGDPDPAPRKTELPGRLSAPGPLSGLTAREQDVLHWVRGGKRDAEISIILGISPRTVHHHLGNILRKLGVETRTAAACLR